MFFIKIYEQIEKNAAVPLESICNLTSSKRVFADDYSKSGIPFYRGKEITLKQAGEPITEPLFIDIKYYNELKSKYGTPSEGDILITAVGTIGNSYLVQNEEFYFKDGNIIWLKNFDEYLNYYVYDFMQTEIFKRMLEGICIGSTQTALTIVALSKLKIKLPDSTNAKKYAKISRTIRTQIQQNTAEIYKLHEIVSYMLLGLSH